LERDAARNVLARAIDRERLANMRATEWEEARDAAQRELAEAKERAAEWARSKGEILAMYENLKVAQSATAPTEILREALKRIARWHGEFPPATSRNGEPSTYGTQYGSNGERDYMRQLALDALAKARELAAADNTSRREGKS
jgi:hypothetical protein